MPFDTLDLPDLAQPTIAMLQTSSLTSAVQQALERMITLGELGPGERAHHASRSVSGRVAGRVAGGGRERIVERHAHKGGQVVGCRAAAAETGCAVIEGQADKRDRHDRSVRAQPGIRAGRARTRPGQRGAVDAHDPTSRPGDHLSHLASSVAGFRVPMRILDIAHRGTASHLHARMPGNRGASWWLLAE